ncbi:hypothetical protein TYRP_000450 [Tyrophagus putrescentiae]|nr:hypothetical protein TYRP_000450 [Tyrophagus putrescentiae]
MNYRYNSSTQHLSPNKGMFGTDPPYDKMYEFGTLATAWQHPVQRGTASKFANPWVKCFFAGYLDDMKALKFIDPTRNSVIRTNNYKIYPGYYYWPPVRTELRPDELGVFDKIRRAKDVIVNGRRLSSEKLEVLDGIGRQEPSRDCWQETSEKQKRKPDLEIEEPEN